MNYLCEVLRIVPGNKCLINVNYYYYYCHFRRSSYDAGVRKKRIIELGGRLRTMVAPNYVLPFLCPLQCVSATSPIKRWGSIFQLLESGLVCSLDQQDTVKGRCISSRPHPLESLCNSTLCLGTSTLPWEKAQASLLEGERLNKMETSHLSWGHSRAGKTRKIILLSPAKIVELQNCELNKWLSFEVFRFWRWLFNAKTATWYLVIKDEGQISSDKYLFICYSKLTSSWLILYNLLS